MLLQGAAIPLPPFGYALNNPAAFTDPDGRIPPVAIAWGLFVLGLTALESDSGTFTSDGIVGDALTALSFLPVIGTEFQIFKRVPRACEAAGWLSEVGSRDVQILQAAQRAAGGPGNFLRDLNALARTVGEAIPGGQVHELGEIGGSKIYGSLVSRVGIAELNGVTQVVSAPLGGVPRILGPLHP